MNARYRGKGAGNSVDDSPPRLAQPPVTPSLSIWERLVLLLFLLSVVVGISFWFSSNQASEETPKNSDRFKRSNSRAKVEGGNVDNYRRLEKSDVEAHIPFSEDDPEVHRRLASTHPTGEEQLKGLYDLLARVLGPGSRQHIKFSLKLLGAAKDEEEGLEIEGAGGAKRVKLQDLDDVHREFNEKEKLRQESGGDFYGLSDVVQQSKRTDARTRQFHNKEDEADVLAGLRKLDPDEQFEYYRFHLSKSNMKLIIIEATSPSAATFGLHQLMKEVLNVSISWGTGQVGGAHLDEALEKMMDPEWTWPHRMLHKGHQQRRTAIAKYRYYYNVCTFGYTSPFWDWADWEKEIDWMALRGINLPLAFVGQEYIHWKLYTEYYKMTTAEVLRDFFTGPAFFPWHWMGNLKRWAGPVDLTWIERRRRLQHKIVRRMRLLGIKPVFPAFAGHIPAAFAEQLPQGSVRYSSQWMGFNESFSGMALLDPTAKEFVEIGTKFMQLQTEEYGATDYYNGDTFNEMFPQSQDSRYLMSASRSVLLGIQGGNPQGKWLVQGWLFLHHRQFWQPRNVAAYLSGAKGHTLVLDLASDIQEVWRWHRSYYSTEFLWCMLHSFGGRRGIFGNVEITARKMIEAVTEGGPTFKGFGLTMEATHHNPVVYEAVTDMFFLSENPALRPDFTPNKDGTPSRDISRFITTYQLSRYGGRTFGSGTGGFNAWNGIFQGFMKLFFPTGPYAHPVRCCPTWSLMSGLPSTQPSSELDKEYNPDYLWIGTAEMFKSIVAFTEKHKHDPEFIHPFDASPPLLADMVDLFRQVLENLFVEHVRMQESLMQHYRRYVAVMESVSSKDTITTFDALAKTMHVMFVEMDELLALSPDFSLEELWLQPAARWATPADSDEDEQRGDSHFPDRLTTSRMIFNAKNIISLWGNGVQGYPNYAAKAWSGLYEDLYLPRWIAYHNEVRTLYSKKQYGFKHDRIMTEILHGDYQWCLMKNSSSSSVDYETLAGHEQIPFSFGAGRLRSLRESSIRHRRINLGTAAYAEIEKERQLKPEVGGNAREIKFVNKDTNGWRSARLMTRLMHTYMAQSPDDSSNEENILDLPIRKALWHKSPQVADLMCKKYGALRFIKKWCTELGGNDMPKL